MAVYKVIQDVEAEDKLVGPLTFRQFVYALVAAGLAYLSYFLAAHGAAFLAAPFILVALFAGFFAFPWGRDQPTELWALAKIRFFFKPRRRVWDQSGAKELVTITAPKKLHVDYTNGLSQTEVKSRLKVLADTLDSRGWAVRNADPTSPDQVVQAIGNQHSDRLVIATPAPVPVIETDVKDADDIMDSQNNPIARQFDSMMNASAQSHREQIINSLQQATPTAAPTGSTTGSGGKWFLGQPMQPAMSTSQNAVTFNEQVVAPGVSAVAAIAADPAAPTPEEEALIRRLEAEDNKPAISYAHLHTIQPLSAQSGVTATSDNRQTSLDDERARQEAAVREKMERIDQQAPPTSTSQTQASVTQTSNVGILDLASNNDLNVATIAREAQKRRSQDEVVISLH